MAKGNFEAILKNNSGQFHPVVPLERTDKISLFDFSNANKEVNAELWNDTIRFMNYINLKLQNWFCLQDTRGYGESRNFYARSKVFNSTNNEEPRRFHLGIDIWGRPHTKVMAPLDGVVHSFAFNNVLGDYGAAIILTHNIDGCTFHSLYGHLSLNSIKNISEGDTVKKGDVFAEFGVPSDNGQWPPHLHFQLIHTMDGMKGDYPGVCKFSEREKYLANCPNPDLILQMLQYAD